jgi:4-hydroxy-tetrahydrodipicolinate synthase
MKRSAYAFYNFRVLVQGEIDMRKAQFLTPVVTAFDHDGNLDIQANKAIYDHLIDGGVDGLVVMGSTGEFFTMTTEQKKKLIDLSVEYVGKRTKLFIGTSCMSVEDTVELSNYAIEAGADAVMIISPYYFALSDESVELFYDSVAEKITGDIYLYNFPQRTGYDLSPEITLNLIRKHKNIVGYKDTVTDMGHTRKLISSIKKEFPEFVILSGFDEFFVHNVLSGGDGCIGGLSNLYPELFSNLVTAVNQKNLDVVSKLQQRVDILMGLYDVGTPFIPIIKRAMTIRGIEMDEYCTKPFVPANEKQNAEIKNIMIKANVPELNRVLESIV